MHVSEQVAFDNYYSGASANASNITLFAQKNYHTCENEQVDGDLLSGEFQRERLVEIGCRV